ncbi:hypothetical protein B1L02_09635 [Pseudoalteromonas piscicida]|uniref:hypothetical protein n=1 Tax=Pseudoalteromonas piscicida TaxID=43662 RepID=UPI000B50D003|nr:hypothetical protein [Pseudoalteromonas piscicida]ASD67263.1 hypothetical protein B1L02_09635 [Pseudoalteromonas piscicida]
MHLKLNKKKIKTLSKDKLAIPYAQTPAIAGGLSNEPECFTYSHGGAAVQLLLQLLTVVLLVNISSGTRLGFNSPSLH